MKNKSKTWWTLLVSIRSLKIFMIMRIMVFLILLGIVQVLGKDSYSQNTKVSLSLSDVTIGQVLNTIESQSEFYFIYNQKLVDVSRRVNIHATNEKIYKVLDQLFDGTNVEHMVLDRQIILSPKTLLASTMKEAKRLQQQLTVTGKVTDEKGGTLPGVNIIEKGTTNGTVTDADGKYTIQVSSPDAILVFSFVGYKSQEVTVGNQNVVNVSLKEETIGLEEVVTIGYSTAKKATVTGSLATVKGDQIKQTPSINVSNSLVGHLPGLVSVTRTGEPGYDDAMLRIRGSNTLGDNSPLIVIDGIPDRNLTRLDPNDIASVTILKDASAAIYGSRAANGVILITTKRGEIGKPTIHVTMNQGWTQPTIIPPMSDAATYAQMINEINEYRGRPPKYTDEDIQKYKDGTDPWGHPNTDWFAATFKKAAQQKYGNVSVSGGTESIRYFVSVGGNFQDGIYKNSATYYNQANFRTNIDGKISKNIHLGFDIAGRQENRNYPTRSSGAIFRMLMRGKPNLPAYWPNGLPGPDIEYGDNPVVITTSQTGYNREKRYVFQSNTKLDITIPWVKGLSLTGNASIDKNFQNHKLWQKPWYLYTWDGTSYDDQGVPLLVKGQRGFSEPRLTQSMNDGQRMTLNAIVNYDRTFASVHHVKALVGYERIKGESMYFSAFRRYFVSTVVDQMFAGGDLEKDNGGSADQNARMSYFGRFNYDYAGKYLVEFVWRYDGSYIFPEDSRFGFFPGVSLGWRMSEENFWKKNLSLINYFKLRASWGQTGNDRIEPYQYMSSYAFDPNHTYVFNESVEEKILHESRIPNPNVTWEVANQTNVGFDGQMFDGKLAFSADYFYNYRTNILWWRNASVPATTGLTLPRENIGKVGNQGFEFDLSYHKRSGTFRYDIGVNGGYEKNKIIFWDETPGVPDYQKSTGHPMNTDLYYKAIGVFKDQAAVDAYPHWANARPGDIIFEDVNDDGVIDGLDRVRIDKNTLPRFTGGVTVSLGYRNFDLSMLLQGATGAIRIHDTESGEIGNFLVEDAEGRWTPDNPNASKPRTWNRDEEYWRNQDNTYWVRNTDYLRLKSLVIGYNIINNKGGINNLRVYFSGMNLLTLDKLKSFDPEVTSTTAYPLNRVFNFGVSLTF